MEGGRESLILHHPQKEKPATLRRPPSQYPIPFPTVDPDDPPQDATEERVPTRSEEVVASSPVRQPQQAPQPTSAPEIPSDVQKIKKPEPEPEETRIEVRSAGTTAPKIKPTSTKPQKSTSYLPIAVLGFVVAGAAACAYYAFTF